MSHQGSRHVDSIVRIYKNAAGDVIALQDLEVTEDRMSLPQPLYPDPDPGNAKRFHRSGNLNWATAKFHINIGSSRVINKIVQIGGYDSWTEDAGNIVDVVYNGGPGSNDLHILLNQLPKIGDTI